MPRGSQGVYTYTLWSLQGQQHNPSCHNATYILLSSGKRMSLQYVWFLDWIRAVTPPGNSKVNYSQMHALRNLSPSVETANLWGFTMLLEDRVVKLCCQPSNKHVLAWHGGYKNSNVLSSVSLCFGAKVIFLPPQVHACASKPKCTAPNRLIWNFLWFLLAQECLNKRNEQTALPSTHFSVC